MNFEPFDTGLVIARLSDKALCPDLRLVGGAADYATVKDLRSFATPSAYVIFAGEVGGQNGPRGASVQPASVTFGVAMAVRNYRPDPGSQLGPELRKVIGQVRSALIGWLPPTLGATHLMWTAGELMDYDDSTALFVDAYQLNHVLKK